MANRSLQAKLDRSKKLAVEYAAMMDRSLFVKPMVIANADQIVADALAHGFKVKRLPEVKGWGRQGGLMRTRSGDELSSRHCWGGARG
jgi:hypothetical protein